MAAGMPYSAVMATCAAPFRPAELLIVEDNPGDVCLTREALREGTLSVNLRVARDGVEALNMLRHRPPHDDLPTPDLILLDLNLPLKSGSEVLREIKSDPHLRSIPVLVMTTSRTEQDVQTAYSLNANGYVAKPVDFDDLLRVVRSIEDFWLRTVTLPTPVAFQRPRR